MREAIEKYPSIARLNEAISGPRRMGSINTVEAYVKGIKRFLDYLGFQDPEMALKAFREGQVNAQTKIDLFIDKELETYAHNTVRNRVFGIKKWLELAAVYVDWNQIEMPTSAEISESDRAPTKEELKVLLSHATDARARAGILVDTSSGLRMGTLLSLKVGDVDFNYPDVASIKVERKRGRKFVGKRSGSQGRVFFTFITPEARKALQEYLDERKRTGETLTPESPLIADANYKGKFSTLVNFERIWYRLLKRAGLADKSHRWYKLHLHTLRKYFRSNCVGIDASYREHWMGHKSGYLDESYFRAEESQHLAEYRKAIPHLAVYSTGIDEKKQSAQAAKAAYVASHPGTTAEQLTEQFKKIEEIFAKAKDTDDGFQGFRKFIEDGTKEEKKPKTMHDGNGRYLVAKDEEEMIAKLHDGYKLVQSLSGDKYLLEIQ